MMQQTVWRNGLLSGGLNVVYMWFLWFKNQGTPNFENGMLIGYLAMAVSLSFIFIGVWQLKKKLDTPLYFGRAFLTGLFIALISSVLYATSWLIVNHYLYPNFMQDYMAFELKQMKDAGVAQADIDAMAKEMVGYAKLYENPFWAFAITISEILPVGFIFSLAAALIFKNSKQ